ncbi:MAG: PEGA domain-containing protein, partial [bacterium]
MVELRNEAELKPSEVAYLTDQVRSQASESLLGERFLVMTRESIVALLPPGKTLADCQKTQCEVEVGRTIGADYIVTGEVLRFDDELRLNLKVHHCVSGAFLGSQTAKGARVKELETGLATASRTLFAQVRTHAGAGGPMASSPTATPDGIIGSAPQAWSPTTARKALVRFASTPGGAVVLVDGQLLCQSTPCSKLVPIGVVQVQMQRERYSARTEAVTVGEAGTAVEWSLSPTFGWLTVRSTPDSLPVTVNGEAAGRTPLVRREVDPGQYEVRLADARYHETGERVTVATGEARTVTLSPVVREGAIEVTATDAAGNDVAGTLTVDGTTAGAVPGTYKLMVGRRRLSVNGGTAGTWRGEVTVTERTVTPVVATLVKPVVRTAPAVSPKPQRAGQGTASDVVVRGDLKWTVSDNGSDVDWNEAKAYCEACQVGGYTDWRMPSIEELQGLYVKGNSYATSGKRTWSDGSTWTYDVHIAKPFRLTAPWMWSSTLLGSSSAFGFVFDFGDRLSLD